MAKSLRSVGWRRAVLRQTKSVPKSLVSSDRPLAPMPVMRIAFCRASSKVLPMDITSPTDFISLPSLVSTSLNLERSQRGILTTQ